MKRFLAITAILAAVLLSVPVMAADTPGPSITVGGRLKYDVGWQILSKGNANNVTDSTIVNFYSAVNNDTYLRAIFSSADKTTGAHIELALGSYTNLNNRGGTEDESGGTSIRYAYGWWKTGFCKLLVGQYASALGGGYDPGFSLGNNKGNKSNLYGFGFIGGTRNPKVGLQVEVNENFTLDVALGQAGSEVTFAPYSSGGAAGNTSGYLPRLEAVFGFKFGNFSVSPGFGVAYMNYKYDESGGSANYEDNILSYLLWLPVKYQNGPFGVWGNVFYGQNRDSDWTGEKRANDFWGWSGGSTAAAPRFTNGGSDIENTISWGLGLAMSYQLTPSTTLRIGGGFEHLSNDAWSLGADGDDNYTRWAINLGLPYKLTSNFTIQPEIGYYNYGDNDDDDQVSEWLVGLHFQVLF